ncbi:MAG: DUF2628 domain-containing protein [bacterium]|nr:DUF2628 domain-containing protein [bacterium]
MKHSEEHYRLYFGRKADYYISIAEDIESGKTVAPNGFAFLFGFFWLMYRKMYISIAIYILLLFVESIIEEILYSLFNTPEKTASTINGISTLAWAIILGLISNRIYINQANRKISAILSLNLPEEEKRLRIQKKGGVTLIPHLIIITTIGIFIFLGRMGYLSDF